MEANPKYIRDVVALLGLEDARPVSHPSVNKTPTTESMVELENERRATYINSCGKAAVHVPRASRLHVQREGDSTKDPESHR